MRFMECVNLLSDCVNTNLVLKDPNIPENILIYRDKGTEFPGGWYSENIFTVARELMNDDKGVQTLTSALAHRKALLEQYGRQAVNYVVNLLTNRRCNRCGHTVLQEPEGDEYPYQCLHCDENMYKIETHTGEQITDEEFDKLVRLVYEADLGDCADMQEME